MDLNQSSPRSVDVRNLDDLGTSRRGRHARSEDANFRTIPDLAQDRRTAERIAAAERILVDIHARARGAGGDPDSLTTVFAIARDCLAEVRELAQERGHRTLRMGAGKPQASGSKPVHRYCHSGGSRHAGPEPVPRPKQCADTRGFHGHPADVSHLGRQAVVPRHGAPMRSPLRGFDHTCSAQE